MQVIERGMRTRHEHFGARLHQRGGERRVFGDGTNPGLEGVLTLFLLVGAHILLHLRAELLDLPHDIGVLRAALLRRGRAHAEPLGLAFGVRLFEQEIALLVANRKAPFPQQNFA